MNRSISAIMVRNLSHKEYLYGEVNGMVDMSDHFMSTVFKLTGYRGRDGSFKGGVVITPQPLHWEKVRDAWTHAVRYTAPGFDLVNYDAAVELLRKRYPSWTIIYPSKVLEAPFEPKRSNPDTEPEVDEAL